MDDEDDDWLVMLGPGFPGADQQGNTRLTTGGFVVALGASVVGAVAIASVVDSRLHNSLLTGFVGTIATVLLIVLFMNVVGRLQGMFRS